MGELDEISRVIGTLEGQVRNLNDALHDARRGLGREIGELKEKFDEHVRAANELARTSREEGFRRIQSLEARLDHIEKDAAKSLAERDRRMSLRFALVGLGFTAVNIVIAVVGLLLR